MTDPILTRLAAATDTEDDSDFLRALSEFDARFTSLEIEDRPAPLDMFCTLWILHQDVTMDGMWKFLGQDEGKAFHEARAWCSGIGAKRAVAYLDAVAKLFPRGRVPRDATKRYAVVEKLEERAARSGDPDPLQALDERYADGMPDLARRMRTWVARNRNTIARQLATLDDPASSSEAQLQQARAVLSQFERLASKAEKDHRVQVAARRESAAKSGLVPGRGNADAQRLARFIDSASRLTQKQWTLVAQRYHTNSKKVEDALMRGFALTQQLRSGQLGDSRGYAQRHEKLNADTQKLFRITRALPKQATAAGKKVGLLVGANRAVAATAICVRLHDWLTLDPKDAKLAGLAYSLFHGLAWTPDQTDE